MSISAGHSELQMFPYPFAIVFNAAVSAASQIGSVKSYDPTLGRISVRTRISLKSWGEDILIQVVPNGSYTEVRIQSGSSLQVVDWGKNRQNVDHFISVMAARLRNVSPAAPAQAIHSTECSDSSTRSHASFCCACGFKLPPESRFCPSCGKRIA